MVGGVFAIFAVIATLMYRMVQRGSLAEESGDDIVV
jgi:hypothetical protein